MTAVKICGVTNVQDARMCVDLGVAAIGLNFVPSSPRCVSLGQARVIAASVHGRVEVVGVVANWDLAALKALLRDVPLDRVQLHGDEPVTLVQALYPVAYKAVRIATAADVAIARSFPGEDILVDAKVPGVLGGSGHVFDWSLVVELAKERRVTLAGGLNPDNVGHAVRVVSPYRVDVASGVDDPNDPRKKDASRVRAFVAAAREPRSR